MGARPSVDFATHGFAEVAAVGGGTYQRLNVELLIDGTNYLLNYLAYLTEDR